MHTKSTNCVVSRSPFVGVSAFFGLRKDIATVTFLYVLRRETVSLIFFRRSSSKHHCFVHAYWTRRNPAQLQSRLHAEVRKWATSQWGPRSEDLVVNMSFSNMTRLVYCGLVDLFSSNTSLQFSSCSCPVISSSLSPQSPQRFRSRTHFTQGHPRQAPTMFSEYACARS